MRRSSRIVLPIVGGIAGFLAESVHRRAGVWSLPNPGELPLWIALVYALGIAALNEGFRRFERVDFRPGRLEIAADALIFVILFLLPPLLHRHELALTMLTIGYLAARLTLRRAPGDLVVALVVAGADVALEAALVAAGLYHYSSSRMLPLWLAPLWAAMAISLRRLFRAASA